MEILPSQGKLLALVPLLCLQGEFSCASVPGLSAVPFPLQSLNPLQGPDSLKPQALLWTGAYFSFLMGALNMF